MPGAAFSGNYTHNIDPKGRVTIPAAYRDALGVNFTIGMNNDSLPACMVTLIDANHARIQVAPWTKSQDIGMGKLAVEYAGDANTVIMKHHGVISFGKDLEEALYAAVYLEEAAKTYVMARIMGAVPELSDEQIADEAAGWEVYGQNC